MRRLFHLLFTVVVVVSCGSPAPDNSTAQASVAPAILSVEPGAQVQSAPKTEAAAQELSVATQLADQNGNDLGYPWIDPATGTLVLSAVTQKGRDLIGSAGFAGPIAVREVSHGAAELQRIQDEATTLAGHGVPGADVIYQTMPDERDNRALLVIRSMDQSLLEALAARYPAEALAVEVLP